VICSDRAASGSDRIIIHLHIYTLIGCSWFAVSVIKVNKIN